MASNGNNAKGEPQITGPWQKAELSNGTGGGCFELAPTTEGVAIRQSTDPNGPILYGTKYELLCLLDGCRNGEFDHLLT
jgi:hypothetical protein